MNHKQCAVQHGSVLSEPNKIAPGLPLEAGTPGELDGASRCAHFSKRPKRPKAFLRYATESDLDRIEYVKSINHLPGLRDLKPRARRFLAFLYALRKTGRTGYEGTSCCQQALASAVKRATGEAFSLTTLKRADAELLKEGLIEKDSLDMQRFIQCGPDHGVRTQLCIYKLTDKALDILEGTKRNSSDNCTHSPNRTTLDRKRSDLKNQNPAPARNDNKEQPAKPRQSDLIPPKMPPVKNVHSSGQSGNGFDGETRNRKAAKNRILHQLAHYTRFKGHEGKLIVRRAEMELRGDVPRGMKCSGVDWEYWIGKWRLMSKEELRHVVLRKLIPGLESGSVVVTCQPVTKANHMTALQLTLPEPPPPDEAKTMNTLEELRCIGLSEKTLAFLAKKNAVTW